MKKLQFKISINAPLTKVYDFMLGISSKSTYKQWTSLFNPTSLAGRSVQRESLISIKDL
jgi:hypothetical protein